MRSRILGLLITAYLCLQITMTWAANAEVLRPRVPAEDLPTIRAWPNPFRDQLEAIGKGKTLYFGKGFCAACHGQDGKGLASDVDRTALKGPLPRDFTDKQWQRTRTDGELLWILKNGSPGTDMAPFIPLVLTDEEAWQVLAYIRALGQ